MERKQDNEIIYADTPEFDGMIGMTHADFQSFVDTYIGGCKEWKPGVSLMSAQELLAITKALRDVNILVSITPSGKISLRTKL